MGSDEFSTFPRSFLSRKTVSKFFQFSTISIDKSNREAQIDTEKFDHSLSLYAKMSSFYCLTAHTKKKFL